MACTSLIALAMAMCIFPSFGGTENQNLLDGHKKIDINSNQNVIEVNAAYKVKVKVRTKVKVKVRYKYRGKWRTKYVYKWKTRYVYKYKTVKAASTYTVSRSYISSSSGSWKDDPKLDAIIKSGSRFGYSHARHTGAALEKYGSGDCWAISDWLNRKLKSAGYKSRIIQYATSYSSRHRSVQVYRNGAWQKVPYRSYGYHYLFV